MSGAAPEKPTSLILKIPLKSPGTAAYPTLWPPALCSPPLGAAFLEPIADTRCHEAPNQLVPGGVRAIAARLKLDNPARL